MLIFTYHKLVPLRTFFSVTYHALQVENKEAISGAYVSDQMLNLP